MEKIQLSATIPKEYAGSRLDIALAKLFPEHSRSRLSGWIKAGVVWVDEENTYKPKDKVKNGQDILIDTEIVDKLSFEGEDIPLDIVFEDNDIIVVNKPKNLCVHPAPGNPNGTLLNALLYHYPSLTTLPRAGIVHRLDMDTTGLMVVAKSLTAHTSLVGQLQERKVKREYYALVNGQLSSGGKIETLMGRHPTVRVKMAVVTSGGKEAITHYSPIDQFQAHTLVKVNLETGRTHQIRVHMAHIGHPLVGDKVYGAKIVIPPKADNKLVEALNSYTKQALHAHKLAFTHPQTKQPVEFEAKLPNEYKELLSLLAL